MFDHASSRNSATASQPRPPRRPSRGVLALVLTAGLAAGGAGIAHAAGNTPTTPPNAVTAPAVAGAPAAHGPAASKPGPGADAATDTDGRVSAVSSSHLSVTSGQGTARSYALTSGTRVHQGRQRTLTASGLRVGDRVHVRGQAATSSGGSLTAVDVDLHLAHIDGTVTTVNGDVVTVTDRDGFTRHITTRDAAAGTAVHTGEAIHAEGRVDADGTTLDATSIGAPVAKHGAGPGHGRAGKRHHPRPPRKGTANAKPGTGAGPAGRPGHPATPPNPPSGGPAQGSTPGTAPGNSPTTSPPANGS